MGVIDRAILQDEIRQALNTLYQNGQVPRTVVRSDVVIPTTTLTLMEQEIEHDTSSVAVYNHEEPVETNLAYPLSDDLLDDTFLSYLPSELTINFNGRDYVCPRQAKEGVAYGNCYELLTIMNGSEPPDEELEELGIIKSSEPFVMFLAADVKSIDGKTHVYFKANFTVFDEQETATVKVDHNTETIHPIDPKFIPGAVLPVVEVKSFYATPTEEENKALTAFIGLPIIVKGAVADGVSIAAVMMYGLQSGSHVFSALMGADIFIGFQSSDGITWEPYGQ